MGVQSSLEKETSTQINVSLGGRVPSGGNVVRCSVYCVAERPESSGAAAPRLASSPSASVSCNGSRCMGL